MVLTMQSAETLVSAAIAYVELRSALAAAMREGRIALAERERIVLEIEQLWQGVSEIPMERPLLRHAGDLADRMSLRGYDAVHLAAVLQCGAPGEVALACWDTELRRAARDLGYSLIPS